MTPQGTPAALVRARTRGVSLKLFRDLEKQKFLFKYFYIFSTFVQPILNGLREFGSA